MIHELKILSEYYNEVLMNIKTFEIRQNDRDFKIGDVLILKEWDSNTEEFSGRKLARNVTYILNGGSFGLESGFVIMSIK